MRLWYKTPASDWMREALPIGNGYMGAMIFGGISEENLQYNENTAWDGGPIDGDANTWSGGNRSHAAAHLNQVREKLWNGQNQEALSLANKTLTGMYEHESGAKIGAYQAFGNLRLIFSNIDTKHVINYERELDLEKAVVSVSFEEGSNIYKREYFCSYPDNIIVIRLTCSNPSQITCEIETTLAHEIEKMEISNDCIMTRGRIYPNKMLIESQIKVLSFGTKTREIEGKICVDGADEVVILMALGTNYENIYPTYRGEDPHESLTKRIDAATKKSYSALLNTHVLDYKYLYNRLKLKIYSEYSDEATDQLLKKYDIDKSIYLQELFFQYGRYLLIASSREGSLPANLQGVWNRSNTPAWRSDYHFNINIQMNYWLAFVSNLEECAVPLLEYIESLRVPGHLSATQHYGVSRGWCVNCANDIFGYTAPGNKMTYGWAPNSNAFIAINLWDYYRFTKDKQLLKNRIYPILKEAAAFWADWLIQDRDGTLVSAPSYSPEQGEIGVGVSMDQQLAYELFSIVIEASKELEIDTEFCEELLLKRSKLSNPVRIGRYGQIQEWKEDIDDEKTNNHRHISQLVGLYPGTVINKGKPELLEAAKITLQTREKYTKNQEITGWSIAWQIALWARTLNSKKAYEMVNKQFLTSTYNNLFDHCAGPFQIDGNLGYVAGVAEMLLQSHMGYLEFLPALPHNWENGKVEGLAARGGFIISCSWVDGKIQGVEIYSKVGGNCAILKNTALNNVKKIEVVGTECNYSTKYEENGVCIYFDTKQQEKYHIYT